MATLTRYPTKPIEVWQKMKELRRWHFRHTWEAQAKGEVVVIGVVETYLGLLGGLGDFANPSFGPYFTVLMRNPNELIKVMEAAEAYGFNREMCSSMRCHLGQLVSGLVTKNPKGGEVVPDVVFQFNVCHSMVKTGQLFGEILNRPYFVLDVPYKQGPIEVEYQVNQLMEAIEWLEKKTGHKYDDEKFIEAVNNEWETSALYSRICEMLKKVPATYDMRQMWSLRLPLVTIRHHASCVEYTREWLAETEERVKEGISSRGYETGRFLQEGIPPFYHIQVLRLPAEYGAVFVSGEILLASFGCWTMHPDGSWTVPQTPRERGWELKTREDGVRALVDLYLLNHPNQRFCHSWFRPEEIIWRAREWKCDGVVLHLDRGCKGYQSGMMEAKLALQEAGIPTTTYESSQADPRDFVQSQVYDHLESFFESLGLRKIAAEKEKEEGE